MPTRNKTAGNRWERLICQMLRNTGIAPHAATSRAANFARDAQGVDITNSDEGTYGRLQYDVQAKTTVQVIDFWSLLEDLKQRDSTGCRLPVIFWCKTVKKGTRFVRQNDFAICLMEDYLSLMKSNEISKTLLPVLPIILQELSNKDPQQFKLVETRLKELQIL